MTPRVDAVALDQTANFEKVMELSKSSTYSRIPVYSETFDNVTGILYVKDLIRYVDMPSDFNWQKFIRTDIIYAPESKKISDLLEEFQEKKMHMAIVVDEYGGSSGIATLEDIMEEIVGEIRDEFEEEDEIDFVKVDDDTFIFEGKVLLNDVLRIIDENPDYFDNFRGDADSMAGLILELTGKLPKLHYELKIGKYLMRVKGVNKRRIEQVRVTRLEK
jgi:CBS domain containing-hemolysin-like protein